MTTADELSDAFDLVRQEVVRAANMTVAHDQRLDGQNARIRVLEHAARRQEVGSARGAGGMDSFALRIAAFENDLSVICDRIASLEAQMSALPRHNARIADLDRRLDKMERATPPHDSPVTSTGEAKPMKRWVITTAETGSRFSRWKGMVRPGYDVGATSFFETPEEAEAIRKALFSDIEWLYVGEVEVVERDGKLVEARYV